MRCFVIDAVLEKKDRKKSKFSLKSVLYFVVAIAVMIDIVYIYLNHGHAGVIQHARTAEPIFQQSEAQVEAEADAFNKWQSGWVLHDDQVYAYKEGIMTFLVMCTEGQSGIAPDSEAYMLFVLDTQNKHLDYIPINRHTMLKNGVDGREGTLVQLARQADEGEDYSRQVNLISRFMHQLPIHGYAAITMDGVIPLTKALGGVDLTASEDITYGDKFAAAGETIHLEDTDVVYFLAEDDYSIDAETKLVRKELFLKALITKVYTRVKSDPISFMNIFNSVDDYVHTNMTTSEIMYLATEAAGYELDEDSAHAIEGESVIGDSGEEFYADEELLKDMLINIFYEKVNVTIK